jgi:DNA-binding response OmpR family regulator
MARVLVIDDDAGTLLGYKGVLRAAGSEVATAALGEDGIAAARGDRFDLVLCDQRLPDRPGIEVVREIHESGRRTAIVLVTAWSTPELILEAKRAGATTYAAKPLVGDDLVAIVDRALRLRAAEDPLEHNPVGYAARRWVDLVVRGVHLVDDPKSVLPWCRGIAIAHSTLKKRCDAVRATPKDSLDFVRLLHVAIHHAGEPWNLQSWLNILDSRTARALMERVGFSADHPRVPDVAAFLSQQRLIGRPDLIDALRARLIAVSDIHSSSWSSTGTTA